MDGRRNVLVLGGTGMLGHVLFTELARRPDFDVWTAVRAAAPLADRVPPPLRTRILDGVDAADPAALSRAFEASRPGAVLNAVGLIKQLPLGDDPLAAIVLNAELPHRLAALCRARGARLVHFSTDCVFSGRRGHYAEGDEPDARDFYGRVKLLGEATGPGCLTLRTSIIGHELRGGRSLLEWFLSQSGPVRGYRKAVFSGFPTVEVARIVAEYVLPNAGLEGLYHVASAPISKFDLLRLIADRYARIGEIEPADDVDENRSLDASRFRAATGYVPPSWPDLVDRMHAHFASSGLYGAGPRKESHA